MPSFIHFIGSYPLLIGLLSQFVVLYGAWKTQEKPAMVQATLLILALASAAVSVTLRPHSPPQLLPDLFGCVAALFLLTPAVEAIRKMVTAKKPEDAEKSKSARA